LEVEGVLNLDPDKRVQALEDYPAGKKIGAPAPELARSTMSLKDSPGYSRAARNRS